MTEPALAATADKAETRELFRGIADSYERGGALLSFGQDPLWRRFLVDRLPVGAGDTVLDVATGTGAVASLLVRRRGCSVVGIDQSPEMLAAAREGLAAAGIADRVELVEGEAEALPFPDGRFDGLSVTYLLRYVDDPAAVLRELVRVMKPGATFASLEFGVPPRRLMRAGWRVWTSVGLPLAGRMMSRGWGRAARFLNRSIPEFYRRHPLPALLDDHRAAGLRDIRVRRLTFGAAVVIWGVKA
jgi:demethylmenaquinone methyltransferase/2-methoxy-6-polyprenyl-1,4-benzoquinol methylase